MIAPVLGAFMVASFSMPVVMFLDIIGALIAVGAIASVAIPDPERNNEQQHVVRELLEGLKVINENKVLKSITISMMLTVLVYLPVSSLFPLMVNGHFNGTAWHAGVVEFAFAGGLLASSLILGIWSGMDDKFAMMSLAIGALGIALAASGLLPPAAFIAFVALSAMMGFTGSFFTVPYIAYIQSSVPLDSLGRVLSLVGSLMALATPIGLFMAGPLAEATGVANWFFLSGVVIMLAGLLAYFLSRKALAQAL
jgi:DHA3 family macrolide efflux protein-like MFS transporter